MKGDFARSRRKSLFPPPPLLRRSTRHGRSYAGAAEAACLEELCATGIDGGCAFNHCFIAYHRQKRRPIGTLFEIFIPCLFFVILVAIRAVMHSSTASACLCLAAAVRYCV